MVSLLLLIRPLSISTLVLIFSLDFFALLISVNYFVLVRLLLVLCIGAIFVPAFNIFVGDDEDATVASSNHFLETSLVYMAIAIPLQKSLPTYIKSSPDTCIVSRDSTKVAAFVIAMTVSLGKLAGKLVTRF